jgi:hypothetical protein
VVRPGAPFDTLPLLLRQFVRDCGARGCSGVFTYMDPKNPTERFLMSAMRGMGGTVFSKPQFVAAASLAALERW